MFKKIVETIVGGAIGFAALYLVAKVAYEAGRDVADAEHRANQTATRRPGNEEDANDEDEETPEPKEDREAGAETPDKKIGKIGMLLGLRKLFRKGGKSVLGELVHDPEDHKLEAYVHEGEVHINIKKRRSFAPGAAETT